jgi:hypothetical protein
MNNEKRVALAAGSFFLAVFGGIGLTIVVLMMLRGL